MNVVRSAPLLAALAMATVLPSCETHPAPASPKVPSTSPVPDTRALAIADQFMDDELEHSPDDVALLRPPNARYDRLPDDSLEGLKARHARQDAWLAELRDIDAQKLKDSRAILAWQLTTEALATRAQTRACRLELWNVSQVMQGWQVRFVDLAEAQPVGTADFRVQARKRFSEIPRWVDDHIASLREGLRLGYVAAELTVNHVLDQLDKLAAMPPRESPFFSPAARDGDPAFQKDFERIVGERIQPSVRKYRQFLATEYLPHARKRVTIAANPDGEACYRALVRESTSLAIDPADVHKAGWKQLSAIEAEMKALSDKSFGGAPIKALLERFREDETYRFKSREDVIRQAESTLSRGRAIIPKIVNLQPKGNVGVEPIPAFQEKTSPAHYLAAALDGSRPATYRIRLYEPQKQNRVAGESVAFHETIPGHHLQNTIANERTENPRIARFYWIPGFGEGWALYAERLADEFGLYSSDVDRFGMLSSAAFRATRLVVDTGLHAMGWNRERAIQELLAHTAMSPDAAAAEIDRYIAWPGQATAYMIGYMEIASLRQEAQAALGLRFDVKAFHDCVLKDGSLPLPVLRKHVEAWIAERKKTATTATAANSK